MSWDSRWLPKGTRDSGSTTLRPFSRNSWVRYVSGGLLVRQRKEVNMHVYDGVEVRRAVVFACFSQKVNQVVCAGAANAPRRSHARCHPALRTIPEPPRSPHLRHM